MLTKKKSDCCCPYKEAEILDVVKTAADDVKHAKECVAQHIRNEPVRSGAAIASVAYILGKLTRRH